MDYGADVNAALSPAAVGGHLNIVKYLVAKGANVRANGSNALSKAARAGHFEVIKYLVGKGADVRAYDDEALFQALEIYWDNGGDEDVYHLPLQHINIIKYLIKKGANVNARDGYALRAFAMFADENVC